MKKLAEKIFDTTSGSVTILNVAGQIVWINDAFKRFSGYCLADLKGNSRRSFLPFDYEDKFKSMIHDAFLGNSPGPRQFLSRHTSGGKFQ